MAGKGSTKRPSEITPDELRAALARIPQKQQDGLHSKQVDLCRERFEAGDLNDLLYAIHLCFFRNRPVPEWAKIAFGEAWSKGLKGQLKSWDQVFGRPPTKRQADSGWRLLNAVHRVGAKVTEAREQQVPIDDTLFEKIGRDLGIGGKTRTKEIYAFWRRYYRDWVSDWD